MLSLEKKVPREEQWYDADYSDEDKRGSDRNRGDQRSNQHEISFDDILDVKMVSFPPNFLFSSLGIRLTIISYSWLN